MNINRLHQLAAPLAAQAAEVAEHQAAIDLLVLTAYCDRRISQEELDALQSFDSSHSDWDSGAFSVQQYLPIAAAKVRSVLDSYDGADRLLASAAAAIASPGLRAETSNACAELCASDGVVASEAAFLGRVNEALSTAPS
ncbi:MAG TPA: hypothetical protein VME46_24615 [Acidimicrobiales bacterium]|nr:hypothetical protein [Acidimicrobiales bacterium]